ncbi:MAG: dioxygenase [Henriciella sp.]|nr:dioxygenase [Henriciella sp.]
MSENRAHDVVMDIVEGVRDAIRKNDVTFDEYKMAIGYIMKTAQAGELPLMIDVFFNTTLVENMNKKTKGSPNDLQGPYFLEDVPDVTNGKMKTMPHDNEQPMVLKGTIRDTEGNPVPGAEMWIWSSTPDGKYGGFHDNIPSDYYRGKLKTNDDGTYYVESTMPVPYQIPHAGPTGELMRAIGRHTWRPAHVHYKVRAPGFMEFTTQAYFKDAEWVDNDSCSGNQSREFEIAEVIEDGKRIMDIDFVIQPLPAMATA